MAGHQHTERVRYIYDTYIEPALKDVGRLLTHLADDGVIRPIPLRTFHPRRHSSLQPRSARRTGRSKLTQRARSDRRPRGAGLDLDDRRVTTRPTTPLIREISADW